MSEQAELYWRPITTAPKDGTEMLLFPSFEVASWDSLYGGIWMLRFEDCGERGCTIVVNEAPTHWMPLPDAPIEEPAGAAP